MNRIEIQTHGGESPAWIDCADGFISAVLDRLDCKDWDLSVVFCKDEYIRALNAQFRNKDEATDVLSFVLGEFVEENGSARYLPGDIVISLDTLYDNARCFRVSPDEELRRLLIHGILHLNGMDHKTNNADIEPMLLLQEELLAELAVRRIPL